MPAYQHTFKFDKRAELFVGAHLVGVRLRAGGAWPFLGIPLREFTDQVVELETIMGRDIEDLRDTLCEARDDDSRFDLLDRGLVAGLLRKRAWRF